MSAPDQPRQVRTRGRRWLRIRARHLAEYPLCVKCLSQGFTTQAQEVDHIVPLFKGGTDAPSNLQSLCVTCHADKTRDDCGLAPIGCDVFGSPIEAKRKFR
ncbi:phage-like protein [Caballeronia pedi]|uniref:Phage-like protein n=1 Tax=Caballeronia pedi TaxID=1777141 RepID=A0A158AZT9_9BURK|nr:HNH endonuclease signature motif containing protein [Caballeronia pedi]SAK63498.1 phage-like protein [Caballeronia pedi]